jgi:cysteine desulfurase
VIFHSDATQAVGKVPVDVNELNVDLLSISAHKMYGPKGVGALYVRRENPRVEIAAGIDGGGHESGMRSGTLNVPGIVGLGKACAIAAEEMAGEAQRLGGLRERLREKVMGRLDGCSVNGAMEEERRLPGNLNISFAGVDGELLLMGLNDVAVSSGSACNSGSVESSYVLKALGVNEELAQSSLRFGIGRFNTETEIDYVAGRVVEMVKGLRELGSLGG